MNIYIQIFQLSQANLKAWKYTGINNNCDQAFSKTTFQLYSFYTASSCSKGRKIKKKQFICSINRSFRVVSSNCLKNISNQKKRAPAGQGLGHHFLLGQSTTTAWNQAYVKMKDN